MLSLARRTALPNTLLAAVVSLGVTTATARADDASTQAILRECASTGLVAGNHTPAELREAATNMPADAAEYTACPAEIDRALGRAQTPASAQREGAEGVAASPLAAGGAAHVTPQALADAFAAPDAADPTTPRVAAGITDATDPVALPAAYPGDFDGTPVASFGGSSAKTFGSGAAAVTLAVSLLALAGPAMLRRRMFRGL